MVKGVVKSILPNHSGHVDIVKPMNGNKSATLNGKLSCDHDFLHQFYYTMPPHAQGGSQIGVRLAPLAKFDERDFDLPPPSEAKQKVKLFRALLILFTTVILVG